jgi:hypothetical protein
MKTVKLNTGVVTTFDKYDNMISCISPYDSTEPVKMTKLRYYVKQIKSIIQ